jgi:hypothetical protein
LAVALDHALRGRQDCTGRFLRPTGIDLVGRAGPESRDRGRLVGDRAVRSAPAISLETVGSGSKLSNLEQSLRAGTNNNNAATGAALLTMDCTARIRHSTAKTYHDAYALTITIRTALWASIPIMVTGRAIRENHNLP